MINLFELWEKFIGRVNTQQSGAVKPHRNFVHWVNDISISLYEEKFASWGKNQKIKDDMSRPFLKSVNIQVKDVKGSNYGIANYPDDYGHFSAARYFSNNKGKGQPLVGLEVYNCQGQVCGAEGEKPDFLDAEFWEIVQSQNEAEQKKKGLENLTKFHEYEIEEVDNSKWAAMQAHRFKKGTKDEPKITQFDGGFKVMPAGVGMIVFDYLKKPAKAVFGYDVIPGDVATGEGDIIQYNSNKSKHLEWSELVINEFLIRLEKMYGKFVRETFVYQTAEDERQKTV